MISTFAYSKDLSPINGFIDVPVVRHPQTQYMAICLFDNVYWEFDSKHNYAPCLVFDGRVERLDAIDIKFPRNVDTILFNEGKPAVQFRYNLNEEQLAMLAQKGFWSETGVDLPPIFTSAKLQLETDVIIEEVISPGVDVPIFNVELVNPYENTFDATAYELVERITRRKPEANKIVENTVQVDVRQSTAMTVKEAEAAMAERERLMQEKLKPMSKEDVEIQSKAVNINMSVIAEREALRQVREEGNARAEAEREAEKLRIEAEREALAKLDVADEIIVAANETAKLVGGVESNKYSSNNEIFKDTNNVAEPVPEKVAALMKKLSVSSSQTTADKKDEKPDTGSGAASGAQGLGVYTFEDQDAAQVAMRADEGHGNEKPVIEEEKETTDADKSVSKFEKAIASAPAPKIEHEHDEFGAN